MSRTSELLLLSSEKLNIPTHRCQAEGSPAAAPCPGPLSEKKQLRFTTGTAVGFHVPSGQLSGLFSWQRETMLVFSPVPSPTCFHVLICLTGAMGRQIKAVAQDDTGKFSPLPPWPVLTISSLRCQKPLRVSPQEYLFIYLKRQHMERQAVGDGCLDQALEVPRLWHALQEVLQWGPSSNPSCNTSFAALGPTQVDSEHSTFGIPEHREDPSHHHG